MSEEQENGFRWAARTDFGEGLSALAEALAHARAAGRPLLDLSVSNPTRCGFQYDTNAIFGALADPAGLVYRADPLGAPEARGAVASWYYGPHGCSVDPGQVLLTASTSESYGYLLRLLCDPGNDILVPQPSYPLFDLLAQLHDVRLQPYPLLQHDGWRINVPALRDRISPRTRAIVLVHPNNPTGHALDDDERRALEQLAEEHGLSLIVDEVFLDYALERPTPPRSFADGPAPVLTFVLGGLSKAAALPQMKLAWTVVRGPEELQREALHRLEWIADTFLSVAAPAQHALPRWLEGAGAMREQISVRCRENLDALDRILEQQSLCNRLPVQAGWCVVMRVPAILDDHELALHLLEHAGLLVHPGSFYGLPCRGWLVLSLIVPLNVFAEGAQALVQAVSRLVRQSEEPSTQTSSSTSGQTL